MSHLGIQETKEALVAVDEIALTIVKGFKKSGFVGSFAEFWATFQNDPAFKEKLAAGWANLSAVPSEVGDLDLGEAVELVLTEVAYVPKFIAALAG